MQTHSNKISKFSFKITKKVRILIFFICVLLSISGYVSSGLALLIGVIIAQTIGHPFAQYNGKVTHYLLQFSVVGLGFGMNVQHAISVGKNGLFLTLISICSTLVLGFLCAKIFNLERKTGFLINAGTAICGGSAIAAIGPVIEANEKQMSTALGCVFLLNAVALYLFPWIGHIMHLSQIQFGTWCAIAIHDTSSVVGASGKYGAQAQEIATTVKLARALWIIPISIISGFVFKSKKQNIHIPYFIFLFILAMVINTYVPFFQIVGKYIVAVSKSCLTLTLFLIGAGLSRKVVMSVGVKPLIHGILLWTFIAGFSLLLIVHLF